MYKYSFLFLLANMHKSRKLFLYKKFLDKNIRSDRMEIGNFREYKSFRIRRTEK